MDIVEVVQWVALFAMFLLLIGLYRQMSLHLPARSFAGAAGGPAVGSRLPRPALDALRSSDHGQIPSLVAFVAQSCEACHRLIERQLEMPLSSLVLVARRPSDAFRASISHAGLRLIEDDGDIWRLCEVSSTPLVVALDAEGKVISKEVTHRVDKIASASTS